MKKLGNFFTQKKNTFVCKLWNFCATLGTSSRPRIAAKAPVMAARSSFMSSIMRGLLLSLSMGMAAQRTATTVILSLVLGLLTGMATATVTRTETEMATAISLPFNYTPRSYQLPFLQTMDAGKILRAIKVWHRKAGKEKTDFNYMIKKTQERVGNYWYIFPKLTQARKVLWDGIDQNGVAFQSHIPRQILARDPNSTSMLWPFSNGSTLQLIGGDSIDTSIGANPVGVAFSEYSITDPEVWSYVRPILANNGGFAIFNFTPRGENHAYDLWELAKNDPTNWFTELLTVDDTKAIPQVVLDQERREIIKLHGNDSMFQQEYYCSFTVPLVGAYYATHIQRAYSEGRVTDVPIDPRFAVDTWWDLGKGDRMAVWFIQRVGIKIHFVDFMNDAGKGIVDFIPKIREKAQQQGFQLGRHIGPHDIDGTEIFVGKTRKELAAGLGFIFETAPKIGVQDGIDTVRALFGRFWFDKTKCAAGLNAIKNYEKQYDEKRKTFLNEPYHNWASHPADALRTGAVMLDFNEAGRPIKHDRYEDAPARQRFSPMGC